MQKMMTDEIADAMPALYETDGKPDEERDVIAHWFSCIPGQGLCGWHWYGFEYDPETHEVFGFVHGFADEMGYFSIDEFEEINEKHGIEIIERDEHWDPITLAELKEQYKF